MYSVKTFSKITQIFVALPDNILYVIHKHFSGLIINKGMIFHYLECHTKWFSVTPYDHIFMCQSKLCFNLPISEYWTLLID